MTDLAFILVGVGARARTWRRVLADNPHCRIVGMVDTNRAALVAALAETPGAKGAATLAEMTSMVAADAVILSTPPGNRDDQIAAACAARLPILAEKPLADSLANAARHVAAADAAGVSLMVGLNFRYLAVTRALKALFKADRLGDPAFGRFNYERWRDGTLPQMNKYPLTMAQPMLWEQSIHHFDLMRFVYGAEPVAISARTFNPPWSMYADDANVAALITFDNGIEVTYQGTWAGNWDHLGFNWRTDCARGIAVQAEMFGSLSWALRRDRQMTPVTLPPHEIWIDDAAALLADFVAHLSDDAPLHCSGADHLKSLRMVEACLRASATGKTINPSDLTGPAEPGGGTVTIPPRPPQVHTEKRKH
jgi:predicted dehydrogenase